MYSSGFYEQKSPTVSSSSSSSSSSSHTILPLIATTVDLRPNNSGSASASASSFGQNRNMGSASASASSLGQNSRPFDSRFTSDSLIPMQARSAPARGTVDLSGSWLQAEQARILEQLVNRAKTSVPYALTPDKLAVVDNGSRKIIVRTDTKPPTLPGDMTFVPEEEQYFREFGREFLVRFPDTLKVLLSNLQDVKSADDIMFNRKEAFTLSALRNMGMNSDMGSAPVFQLYDFIHTMRDFAGNLRTIEKALEEFSPLNGKPINLVEKLGCENLILPGSLCERKNQLENILNRIQNDHVKWEDLKDAIQQKQPIHPYKNNLIDLLDTQRVTENRFKYEDDIEFKGNFNDLDEDNKGNVEQTWMSWAFNEDYKECCAEVLRLAPEMENHMQALTQGLFRVWLTDAYQIEAQMTIDEKTQQLKPICRIDHGSKIQQGQWINTVKSGSHMLPLPEQYDDNFEFHDDDYDQNLLYIMPKLCDIKKYPINPYWVFARVLDNSISEKTHKLQRQTYTPHNDNFKVTGPAFGGAIGVNIFSCVSIEHNDPDLRWFASSPDSDHKQIDTTNPIYLYNPDTFAQKGKETPRVVKIDYNTDIYTHMKKLLNHPIVASPDLAGVFNVSFANKYLKSKLIKLQTVLADKMQEWRQYNSMTNNHHWATDSMRTRPRKCPVNHMAVYSDSNDRILTPAESFVYFKTPSGQVEQYLSGNVDPLKTRCIPLIKADSAIAADSDVSEKIKNLSNEYSLGYGLDRFTNPEVEEMIQRIMGNKVGQITSFSSMTKPKQRFAKMRAKSIPTSKFDDGLDIFDDDDDDLNFERAPNVRLSSTSTSASARKPTVTLKQPTRSPLLERLMQRREKLTVHNKPAITRNTGDDDSLNFFNEPGYSAKPKKERIKRKDNPDYHVVIKPNKLGINQRFYVRNH